MTGAFAWGRIISLMDGEALRRLLAEPMNGEAPVDEVTLKRVRVVTP